VLIYYYYNNYSNIVYSIGLLYMKCIFSAILYVTKKSILHISECLEKKIIFDFG